MCGSTMVTIYSSTGRGDEVGGAGGGATHLPALVGQIVLHGLRVGELARVPGEVPR